MIEAESTEPQRRPDNNIDTNATHPRKEVRQDGAGQKNSGSNNDGKLPTFGFKINERVRTDLIKHFSNVSIKIVVLVTSPQNVWVPQAQ